MLQHNLEAMIGLYWIFQNVPSLWSLYRYMYCLCVTYHETTILFSTIEHKSIYSLLFCHWELWRVQFVIMFSLVQTMQLCAFVIVNMISFFISHPLSVLLFFFTPPKQAVHFKSFNVNAPLNYLLYARCLAMEEEENMELFLCIINIKIPMK